MIGLFQKDKNRDFYQQQDHQLDLSLINDKLTTKWTDMSLDKNLIIKIVLFLKNINILCMYVYVALTFSINGLSKDSTGEAPSHAFCGYLWVIQNTTSDRNVILASQKQTNISWSAGICQDMTQQLIIRFC